MTTILSIGYNSQLLEVRSAILRTSGYNVLELTDLHLALSTFLKSRADLVLLCDSIPGMQKSILIHCIRTFAKEIPIVVLDADGNHYPADAVLDGAQNPKYLLEAIQGLLERTQAA